MLGLILIAALVIGAIARAIATLWILVRAILALLGSLAIAFAAVIILANLILFRAGPAEMSPAPTAPAAPAVAPTQAAPPSHGTATTTRLLAPPLKSSDHPRPRTR
jgi:hypothetical protein